MYSFVNAALKAKSWTFDAKTKAIKIWPETKASRTTSKPFAKGLRCSPGGQALVSGQIFMGGVYQGLGGGLSPPHEPVALNNGTRTIFFFGSAEH